MKKLFTVILFAVFIFSLGMFAACETNGGESSDVQGSETNAPDNTDGANNPDKETFSGEHDKNTAHVWGEWETVFSSDCVTNGLKICHCAQCGASKAEVIPALGHISEEREYDQSVHFHICTRCGEKYDVREHVFGAGLSCGDCGYICDYTQGLEYEKAEGKDEYRLTGAGDFSGVVLIVPATYKGFPVTEVGDYALQKVQAKKIVLPDSVLNIGYQAFSGSAAEEIVLPKYAQTLGNAAFYGCCFLEKVVLPEGLKRIGDSTFSLCMSLREIVIPDSVVEIGYQAFDHCYTLTKITLGKNLESIEYAFLQCERLLEVYNRSVLPVAADGTLKFGGVARNAKNVYSIGEGHSNLFTTDDGFWCYEGENSVTLLDYTGEKTDVILPDTINQKPVELIGHGFSNADKIESLTVSGGIKNIPSSCFTAMKALSALKLEEGVESVGGSSFTGAKISELYLPASLVFVAGGSFGGNITKIEVAAENPVFTSQGNCLIDKQTKTLVLGTVSAVIPSDGSVEIIGENAFADLSELKEIQIPSAVRKIETRAFFGTGLMEIALSEGTESIGAQAFAYCENLTDVFLPSTVKEIYASAFMNSPIEEMEFSVTQGWAIRKRPDDEGEPADADRLADPVQAAAYFEEIGRVYADRAAASWVKI